MPKRGVPPFTRKLCLTATVGYVYVCPDSAAVFCWAAAGRLVRWIAMQTSPVRVGGETSTLANVSASLACGAIAGAVSRTATAPMDRIKLLMQAAPVAPRPEGMLGAVRSIYADGGARSFFRGNGANCVKIAPEMALKLVGFERILPLLAVGSPLPSLLQRDWARP
jgi:hypothetical protein